MSNRQMPPPSPPQHYPTSRGQSANAPSLPTAFLSREQHPSNPGHRPGSSMSISAMLGSDADRPPRDVGPFSRPPVSSSPSPYTSAPPSANPNAMSPPARPTSLEYPFFRRSQTPEKSFARNHPPARPYRSSSGGVSQASITEQSKFTPLSSRAPPSSQYPDKPGSSQPSPPISSAETAYNESRRLSLNDSIPRPNSQPQIEHLTRGPGYSPLSRPTLSLGDGAAAPAAALATAQSRPTPFSEHGRFGSLYPDRHSEELAQREKERTIGQELDASRSSGHRYSAYGDRETFGRLQGPGAWELGRSQPPSPENKRFPAPEHSPGFGFGAIQSYTKSLGSQAGSSSRPVSLSAQTQPTPPPSEQPPYLHKLQTEPPRLFSSGLSTGPSPLPQPPTDDRRKGSDELMHHRNLLGVGAEKRGRASPLPQAVQGASGPGGESSIKNDLGRVFSGIGSGVGGVTAPTAGSTNSTPIMSPFKRDSGTARSTNGDVPNDEAKISRPGSTTGRRSRKSREEEVQSVEGDMVDLRTGLSGRGRRGRHAHHHHHQYVFYLFTCNDEANCSQSPPSPETRRRGAAAVIHELFPPCVDGISRG